MIECLGQYPLKPLQYIDDFTNTSSCVGAAAKTQRKVIPDFALRTKAKFNMGANKEASMGLFLDETLQEDDVGSPVVHKYRLLGILFDERLEMVLYLNEVIAVARSSFLKLATSGELAGFNFSIIAAQTECNVFSKKIFGSAFLAMAITHRKDSITYK